LDISNKVNCETDYLLHGPYASTTAYMNQLFKDIGIDTVVKDAEAVVSDDAYLNIFSSALSAVALLALL